MIWISESFWWHSVSVAAEVVWPDWTAWAVVADTVTFIMLLIVPLCSRHLRVEYAHSIHGSRSTRRIISRLSAEPEPLLSDCTWHSDCLQSPCASGLQCRSQSGGGETARCILMPHIKTQAVTVLRNREAAPGPPSRPALLWQAPCFSDPVLIASESPHVTVLT